MCPPATHPVSFILFTNHLPTTLAISLYLTLPFMSPINTILIPLSISTRHFHIILELSHLVFPYPRLAISGAYTQTQTYFTIPTIPTANTILELFHPCASMPSHILGNRRSAHPSFPLALFFLI